MDLAPADASLAESGGSLGVAEVSGAAWGGRGGWSRGKCESHPLGHSARLRTEEQQGDGTRCPLKLVKRKKKLKGEVDMEV